MQEETHIAYYPFTSANDILQLQMIDFSRCNGLWHNNVLHAIQAICPWLVGNAGYSILPVDLEKSPQRADWPGWTHVGNHESLGKLYWNWFFDHVGDRGTLHFVDEPDFYGTIKDPETEEIVTFQGDIGQVAASTFALEVLPSFNRDCWWVSVLNARRVIVIMPQSDIGLLLQKHIADHLGLSTLASKVSGANQPEQLSLWEGME